MTLEQKLKNKLAQKQSLITIQNHLNHLEIRIREAYEKTKELAWWVEKEYADVAALEKMTTRGLFRKILGDKEEQLEIERQEYLEAVLEHRDAKKSIELLEFEKKILIEKLKQLPLIEKEVKALLLLREQEIMSQREPKRLQLVTVNSQIDDNIQQKREIYETKIAGSKVKRIIEQIIVQLKKVSESEPWGYQDSWGQMPEPSKYISKSKLENVQTLFWDLKVRLQEFEDELSDIYKNKRPKISGEIINTNDLTNGFYHNLISDWVLRKQVYNVIFQMEALLDRINRVIYSLDLKQKQIDQRLVYLEEKVKGIIVS